MTKTELEALYRRNRNAEWKQAYEDLLSISWSDGLTLAEAEAKADERLLEILMILADKDAVIDD